MQLIPPNQASKVANNKLLLPQTKSNTKINFNRQNPEIGNGIVDDLDKISFAIGIIYLLLVLSWWQNQNTFKLPWQSQNGKETINQNLKISNSDAKFINYMGKSLAAIDRKIEAKKQSKNEGLQLQNNQTKVRIIEKIERVYIPVQAPFEQHSPNRLSVPKPPPIKNKNNLFSQQKISTVETLPTVVVDTGIPHVLVGLFESGNGSVALFSINGVTQRVKIGQQIGKSGWTLVDAVNRTAKISRYGRVRHISTGEQI